MTAVVYQFRDFQSPKDIERLRQVLEREAADTAPCEMIPYHVIGIDLGKEHA